MYVCIYMNDLSLIIQELLFLLLLLLFGMCMKKERKKKKVKKKRKKKKRRHKKITFNNGIFSDGQWCDRVILLRIYVFSATIDARITRWTSAYKHSEFSCLFVILLACTCLCFCVYVRTRARSRPICFIAYSTKAKLANHEPYNRKSSSEDDEEEVEIKYNMEKKQKRREKKMCGESRVKMLNMCGTINNSIV